MKNGKLLARIALIAAGALIVWLSARALLEAPAQQNAIKEAVYLEEPVVLPENEGRMVIIHGKPEMTKPVYDEELGLTIQAIRAYRYDEEYKQTVFSDEGHKFDWVVRGSKGLVGEAKLGEFYLDENTLLGFPADEFYADFDPAEISAYETGYDHGEGERLYVLVGAEYYYDEYGYKPGSGTLVDQRQKTAREREGALAYSYRAHDETRYEAMTAAGIQQGNMLVADEKTGSLVFEGVLSREEIEKASAGYLIGGSAAFLAIGLAMIFLGLRLGGNRPKNDKRKKD